MGVVYSEEFRRNCVEKALNRGNKTIRQLAEEIGISNYALYCWVREHGTGGSMDEPRSRQDRTAQEKLKAVVEFRKLSVEEQGEYLRKEGLLSSQILEWEKVIEEALDPKLIRRESGDDKRRIKELERELNRKEKALAETCALLVLKKKADLIWGTEENE